MKIIRLALVLRSLAITAYAVDPLPSWNEGPPKQSIIIIAAAKPFNLRGGPIGAFTAGHDNPAIDAAIIRYVSTFEQIRASAGPRPRP